MTTEEVEALAMVAWDASHEYQCQHGMLSYTPWEHAPEKQKGAARAAAEAVARAVRDQDAARGGEMPEESIAALARIIADPGDFAPSVELVGSLLSHSAAQGRTIAALEVRAEADRKRFHEVHDSLVANIEKANGIARDLRVTIAALGAEAARAKASEERSLAIADVRTRDALRMVARASRTESALATLRQVGALILPWAKEHIDFWKDDEPDTRITARLGHHVFTLGWCRAFVRAMEGAPSEHPDTATLRAIRERLKGHATVGRIALNIMSLPEVEDADVGEAVARYVLGADNASAPLGDSGPSGGGKRCDECIGPDAVCSRECWRKSTPTTPPDVAASEPTREEDWRTVESLLREAANDTSAGDPWHDKVLASVVALSRLKDEPRRAAAAMRERCAEYVENWNSINMHALALILRALPL